MSRDEFDKTYLPETQLRSPYNGPPPAEEATSADEVARPALGGGGSRDSKSRNFSTCGPTSGPPRSLTARQRNLVQTRSLRLNDFAL